MSSGLEQVPRQGILFQLCVGLRMLGVYVKVHGSKP